MGAKGIVRRMDPVGRVVIPMEIRRALDIKRGDPMEITVEGETIILKKFQESCVFCGSTRGLAEYKGKPICSACRKKIGQLT
jgi:transcriptional pleiotropic regulator of transition state genes